MALQSVEDTWLENFYNMCSNYTDLWFFIN